MESIFSKYPIEKLQFLYNVLEISKSKELKPILNFLENADNRIKDEKVLEQIKSLKSKAKELTTSYVNDTKCFAEAPLRIFHNGVFDILHTGHFNAIRQSKKLGDFLVCGVNSDADVLKVKGPTLMKIDERVALVQSCKWVDEVRKDTPYKPAMKVLNDFNCEYYAHGDEFCLDANGNILFDDIIRENRLRLFKRTEGTSTTVITGRLLMALKDKMSALDMTSPENQEIKRQLEKLEEFEKLPKNMLTSILVTSQRIYDFSSHKVPQDDDKIVYICGDFDILHYAHIEALKKAKSEGDFLYAGIYDDNTARKYRCNNEKYPILNLNERSLNLLGIKYVDEVIFGAPFKITDDMIKLLKISKVIRFTHDYKHDGDLVKKTDEELAKMKEIEDKIFEVPTRLGILKTIELDIPMDNEIIIEKIWREKEGFLKKFLKKAEQEIKNNEEISSRKTKEL